MKTINISYENIKTIENMVGNNQNEAAFELLRSLTGCKAFTIRKVVFLMKKIVACLLALVLSLGCLSAMADVNVLNSTVFGMDDATF